MKGKVWLVALALLLVVLSVIWVSGSALGKARSAVQARPDTPEELVWSTDFLPIIENSEQTSVAVDANGGIHAIYNVHSSKSGRYPVVYLYCASGCGESANWEAVEVAEMGFLGGDARLALDPNGKPHIIYQFSNFIPSFAAYATCQATDCLKAGNWDRLHFPFAPYRGEHGNYFVLDDAGHPYYFNQDLSTDRTGSFLNFCLEVDCTTLSAWQEYKISEEIDLISFSELAITSGGGLRIAYLKPDDPNSPDSYAVSYLSCDTGCDEASNWTDIEIAETGTDADTMNPAISFRLDDNDRPRIAYYTGSHEEAQPEDKLLYYAWCDAADCSTNSANWKTQGVGLPAGYGQFVELELDLSGFPHLAYYVSAVDESADGIGYATCTAGCTTDSPTWTAMIIEDREALEQEAPMPVEAGCTLSTWLEVGLDPSIALTENREPVITYTAKHYQTGGGSCSLHADLWQSRVAVAEDDSVQPSPSPTSSVPPSPTSSTPLPSATPTVGPPPPLEGNLVYLSVLSR